MPGGMLITGMGETSGKSLVTIGLLRDAAERCAHIGLLRPITSASTSGESRIVTLAERLLPEGALSTAAVLTAAEAEDLIAAGRAEEVIDRVLAAWGRLADECDLVIVEGTGAIRGAVPGEPDVNIALARHLDVPVVAVVDGHGRTPERIATRVRMVRRTVAEAHATLLAVVVNRVAEAGVERTRALIPTGTLGRPVPVLPYAAPLTWPSVAEIADAIGATRVGGGGDVDHLVRRITVAAMEVDHALSVIGAGSLVVVPADRGEVIRGILAAPLAPEGVIISGDLHVDEATARAIAAGRVPVYRLAQDTFTVAQAAGAVRAEIGSGNPLRTRQALRLWDEHADGAEILSRLELALPDQLTPERFAFQLAARARRAHARIVLPEGEDDRILTAAAHLAGRGLVHPIVLGERDAVAGRLAALGLPADGLEIVDPATSPLHEELAAALHRARAHKGMTEARAAELVRDPTWFGVLLVHTGHADGMVSGAAHTTADTIRPALQVIGTRDGVRTVSSAFLMCLPDRVLVYGDCAVIPQPTPAQLAEIAAGSAATARAFGLDPRVAMLSYSTGASGSGQAVEQVREATGLARALAPDVPIEGPIQYDAASNVRIGSGKLPGSSVAGHATVYVFPDLNTGNTTYKAVQQSSGAVAIGPVLQGLRRPVNDLSRGCTVDDVVNTILATAVQAGEGKDAPTGVSAPAKGDVSA